MVFSYGISNKHGIKCCHLKWIQKLDWHWQNQKEILQFDGKKSKFFELRFYSWKWFGLLSKIITTHSNLTRKNVTFKIVNFLVKILLSITKIKTNIVISQEKSHLQKLSVVSSKSFCYLLKSKQSMQFHEKNRENGLVY